MKFEQLQPDLKTWFRDMIARRTSRDDLLAALLAAGYQKRMAEDAVAAACAAISAPAPVPTPPPVEVPVVSDSGLPTDAAGEGASFSEQLAQTPNTFATFKAGPIVLDFQANVGTETRQANHHQSGMSMAARIAESFLRQAKQVGGHETALDQQSGVGLEPALDPA